MNTDELNARFPFWSPKIPLSLVAVDIAKYIRVIRDSRVIPPPQLLEVESCKALFLND